MTAQGTYAVETLYLHRNGSLRTKGGYIECDTKERAFVVAEHQMIVKRKKKGFERHDISKIPEEGKRYLSIDLDKYIPPEEMERIIVEASRENYVEFDCVVGIEAHFDEGLEYLALRSEEDDDYYLVYDRYGRQVECHKTRFSRCEPTERALEVGTPKIEYACPDCQDSDYGCASCTS